MAFKMERERDLHQESMILKYISNCNAYVCAMCLET